MVKISVVSLRFEQCGFTIAKCIQKCRWNSKQYRPSLSGLGLLCLLRPVRLKTTDHYGILVIAACFVWAEKGTLLAFACDVKLAWTIPHCHATTYLFMSSLHLGRVKRICVFEHSVMTNFNCACPAIQRSQGSGFLSEGSSWLTACMSEQQRFWRDCADAHARLNLHCSHRR